MSNNDLKVLFVTGVFPRMSETFVLSQIEHAVKQGFEVAILASEAEGDTISHPAVEKYDLVSKTRYYGKLGSWVPKSMTTRWLKAPSTFFSVKNKLALLRALNPLRFGLSVLSLRRFYLTARFCDFGLEQFEVAHGQFGPYGALGAQLKQMGILKGRLLTSFHGYDMSQHLKKVGEQAYSDLFKVGDGFLPISEYWRDRLVHLGCPKSKIVVQRMGIDTSIYQFREKGSVANPMGLLSIGRLVEKKGIEFAIRALSKVKAQGGDFHYHIVGDGPLKDELTALVEQHGLQNQVSFLGWQSQAQIVEHMVNSDLMITPSVTARDGDKEGIPMVLMEAMASGLPVISTYHSGIPELIEDGVSGRLVPERDIDGLANAILQAIHEPDQSRRYAAAGRKQVEKSFDLTRLNQRLVGLYQQHNMVTG
ncbi:MAG: glycosyltransferase [Pseudomonadota bacterium]